MKKLFMFLAFSMILTNNTMAQSADEKEIKAVVETMRKAMVDADKAGLEKIASNELSYGHSSGLIEDKASFVNSIVTGKFGFVRIEFTELTVKILGNTAIVRHKLTGESDNDGKPGTVNIGVMLVMQKEQGQWKLIGRQAYKL